MWAASSDFVSLSIPSWQILTAYAQPFRGAMDLAFCLKVPLDSLFVRASSGGSGETAQMRRLAWTFVAGIGDKYQIRLTRPMYIFAVEQISGYLMTKDNFLQFSIKTLCCGYSLELLCCVSTTYVFMEKSGKWSLHYHQIATLSVIIML